LPGKRFLDGYADATISAWFKFHPTAGHSGQIIAAGDSRGGQDAVTTRINPSGLEDFGLSDLTEGIQFKSPSESIDANRNSWHMLVITLESGWTSSSYKVYLDGAVIDSQKHKGGFSISYDADMPTQIGAIHGTQGWVGLIDELMIFDRALAESEIRQMYFGRKAFYNDWPVEKGIGIGTHDKSCPHAVHGDLRKHIEGALWQWDGGHGEKILFGKDGYIQHPGWTARGLVTKWTIVDCRTVLLEVEKGRTNDVYAVLLFSNDCSSYAGYNFLKGYRLRLGRRIE